jgi:hypothetical protein
VKLPSEISIAPSRAILSSVDLGGLCHPIQM